MWRSLLNLVLIAVAGYAFLVAFVYLTQDRMVYFPTSTLVTTPDAHGLDYEDVVLVTDDGVRLHAWFVPAQDARATLLFFHGNGGNLSYRIDSLRIFHDLGLSVLILSYRGYGLSEGRPSEVGIRRDATAAWGYLREDRGIPAEEIIVFGRSLGAAVGAELAARERPGAVILESAFTSAAELAADVYPWLPVRWLVRYEYDVRGALRDINAPVLIAHSRDDEIVPFQHALELEAAAGANTRLLEMRGGHNDGFLRTGATYRQGLHDFLGRHLDQ